MSQVCKLADVERMLSEAAVEQRRAAATDITSGRFAVPCSNSVGFLNDLGSTATVCMGSVPPSDNYLVVNTVAIILLSMAEDVDSTETQHEDLVRAYQKEGTLREFLDKCADRTSFDD